jgi:hypothetical protein
MKGLALLEMLEVTMIQTNSICARMIARMNIYTCLV